MSTEENLLLVRRYFTECVSGASGPDEQRALAVVDELLTSDFAMFYNSDAGAAAMDGPERHKEFLIEHARNFPEDDWTVEALVADQETVACQWRIEATHAKTGNRIDLHAADFFQVRNGRLAELRRFLDFKSFEGQNYGSGRAKPRACLGRSVGAPGCQRFRSPAASVWACTSEPLR